MELLSISLKRGDTLWRVAAIAGLTLEELMAMNGIQPGDFHFAGDAA